MQNMVIKSGVRKTWNGSVSSINVSSACLILIFQVQKMYSSSISISSLTINFEISQYSKVTGNNLY